MGNVQGDQDRQGGKRHHRRAHAVRRSRIDGGRRHRAGRMVDAELQGWPCRHRQGAGGAALSDDRGHRFRGHRRAIVASAMEGRRQGDLQRLGHGRDPSRRLCREGARQGRLAGAPARGHVDARRDGDRHRRLHRDALGAGAGKARPDARSTARSSSPAPPAASARSRPRCCRSSAITSSPRPAACRKPTISRVSARPR